MLTKLISGGQTGVDRATLDLALQLGLPCGGWCPKGRLAEDGPIPLRHPLQETPSEYHDQRTEWNVRDSDGTLILLRGEPTGGTKLTIEQAARHAKPYLVVDLGAAVDLAVVQQWLLANRVEILNVVGPRESEAPGIYDQARAILLELLALPGELGQ